MADAAQAMVSPDPHGSRCRSAIRQACVMDSTSTQTRHSRGCPGSARAMACGSQGHGNDDNGFVFAARARNPPLTVSFVHVLGETADGRLIRIMPGWDCRTLPCRAASASVSRRACSSRRIGRMTRRARRAARRPRTGPAVSLSTRISKVNATCWGQSAGPARDIPARHSLSRPVRSPTRSASRDSHPYRWTLTDEENQRATLRKTP